MKKIALISLGVGSGEFSQFTKKLLSATVALYYIKATLENHGFEVALSDQPNTKIGNQTIITEIQRLNPDVILFSQFFNTRERIRQLILSLKESKIMAKFGVGGHDASFHSIINPEKYQIFDIVFQGPVLGIISSKIDEIIKAKKTKTVFIKTLKKTEDPNCLPVLEHNNYFGTGFIVGSLGCFRKGKGCSFCTTPQFCPSGWRKREIKSVFYEAENLIKNGRKYFFLVDDESLMDIKRGNDIILGCRKMDLKMMLMTKPAQILKAEKFKYIQNWNNVKRIFLGLENGSPDGLGELGKKIIGSAKKYLDTCIESFKILKANRIAPFTGHINFTGPKTNFFQLRESGNFLHKIGECDWTALTQAWRPYPGTVKSDNFSSKKWLEEGEILYHFNDQEVEKFHRFIFHLRKETDPVDNIIYSLIDEIYFRDPGLFLWNKYKGIKKAWNDITYEFFIETLEKFKNKEKVNPSSFLAEKEKIKKEADNLYMLLD